MIGGLEFFFFRALDNMTTAFGFIISVLGPAGSGDAQNTVERALLAGFLMNVTGGVVRHFHQHGYRAGLEGSKNGTPQKASYPVGFGFFLGYPVRVRG